MILNYITKKQHNQFQSLKSRGQVLFQLNLAPNNNYYKILADVKRVYLQEHKGLPQLGFWKDSSSSSSHMPLPALRIPQAQKMSSPPPSPSLDPPPWVLKLSKRERGRGREEEAKTQERETEIRVE